MRTFGKGSPQKNDTILALRKVTFNYLAMERSKGVVSSDYHMPWRQVQDEEVSSGAIMGVG